MFTYGFSSFFYFFIQFTLIVTSSLALPTLLCVHLCPNLPLSIILLNSSRFFKLLNTFPLCIISITKKIHHRLICFQHQSLSLLNVKIDTIRRTILDIKVILISLLLTRTQQNSQRWYFARENLQEVFLMLVVVVVFPHWRLLLFWATFPCHRHSTLASQAHECLQRL